MDETKQCLQAMLSHITDMVCLMEYEDVKTMERLVNMAISLSAQLQCDDAIQE